MFPEIFNEINADIIGLQEVSFLEYNQINDLFTKDNIKDYSQYKAKSQMDYAKANDLKDVNFIIDGNAICFKKSIESSSEVILHQVLHLSPVRNCHCLSFTFNEIRVHFVNVHLHHIEEDEIIRVHQMRMALKWVQNMMLIYLYYDFSN